jgi:hypothetical protein
MTLIHGLRPSCLPHFDILPSFKMLLATFFFAASISGLDFGLRRLKTKLGLR